MTLPGTVVTERDQITPRTAPTDTGVWFVAGLAERGPLTPQAVTSMSVFRRIYGERTSYSVLYDAVETAFQEGATLVYVRRVVGAAAVTASLALSDGTATTLTVKGKGPGDYYNSLKVAVTKSGSTFQLTVSDASGTLETSPVFSEKAEAIAWSESSEYIVLEDAAGTSLPATVAATALTGGDDKRSTITDSDRVAALADFPRELGPGQVSIPGATSAAAHEGALQHAADRNRFAYLDAPDSATVGTVKAAADAIRALGALAKHGALFGPWAKVPGSAPGTTRTVPYSAVQAGMTARVDAEGNPNAPAAGAKGVSRYAVGVTQTYTDAERETLNDAGVNVARMVYGQVRTYGYRTVADPSSYPLHWQASNVRTDMAVVAKADEVAERHVFAVIDGKGIEAAAYEGELRAMLAEFYRVGALYGATADDAFSVDVGPAVNTPETIAAGRLRAVLAIRRAPFAEQAEVEVVKVAITQAV